MDNLIIRPARPEEIDRLADIINDPPSRATLKIAGSYDKAISGGRILCRKGISLRIEQCTVAEVDGTVVGVMDASANRRDPEVGVSLVLQLLVPVVRTVGFDGLWRLLQSRPAWARSSFEPQRAPTMSRNSTWPRSSATRALERRYSPKASGKHVPQPSQ